MPTFQLVAERTASLCHCSPCPTWCSEAPGAHLSSSARLRESQPSPAASLLLGLSLPVFCGGSHSPCAVPRQAECRCPFPSIISRRLFRAVSSALHLSAATLASITTEQSLNTLWTGLGTQVAYERCQRGKDTAVRITDTGHRL